MGTAWRLIRDGDRDAAMNMAVDEALMTACIAGECAPALRLYGWEYASISLGYFQDLSRGGIDLDYCEESAIQLVRRLTGGRAVLHGHDLTFSIVVSEADLPAEFRSVIGSHSWLMRGIVEGLREVGVDARLGGAGGSSSGTSADCFAHAAACDIVVDGRKIAGSAQVRRSGAILEQGSIPFRRPEIEPSQVFQRKSDMSHGLGRDIDRATLEDAVILGFRHGLGIELAEHPLSQQEIDAARGLADTRFGNRDWTLRRPGAFVDIRQ